MPSAVAKVPASDARPGFFHQLLSELNPLQYVPVVGTIYRAVTGDTIPESARFAGSLVLSGLTGGPIGLALNVGTTLVEHLLDINPEKIGDQVLASLGIGSGVGNPDVAIAAASPSAVALDMAPMLGAGVTALQEVAGPPAMMDGSWSPAQLTAYGISSLRGVLTRGTESGADVLNSLELARINQPFSDAANLSAAA